MTTTRPETKARRAIARARRLRPSLPQRLLWACLKGGGHNSGRPGWRRQAHVAGALVDFYCAAAKLVVVLQLEAAPLPVLPFDVAVRTVAPDRLGSHAAARGIADVLLAEAAALAATNAARKP